MNDTTRIAILGASGYSGGELVRLLSRHPAAEIVVLTAERHAGKPVRDIFPSLGALELPDLMALDDVEWAGVDVDVVFCALPHATTQSIVRGLFHAAGHSLVDEMIVETTEDIVGSIKKSVRVVDLSADFRLRDPEVYRHWYDDRHTAPELQKTAVYGLTELNRAAVRDAALVANPGCYPTAALLPLIPLLEAGQIDAGDIVIDAKSGVSGAGRALTDANLFSEVSEGIHAYGLTGHRHAPEIEQELSVAAGAAVTVSFTPHLVPVNRGILSTTYVRLAAGASAADLRATLAERYDDEPFVTVLGEGLVPDTRHVRGTNRCLINVFAGRGGGTGSAGGRAVVLSVIDNLVKGAAGQAVQNMNAMLGLPETTGLEAEAVFP